MCIRELVSRLGRYGREMGDHADTMNRKLEKTIPGAPENETPVHLRKKQVCRVLYVEHTNELTSLDLCAFTLRSIDV